MSRSQYWDNERNKYIVHLKNANSIDILLQSLRILAFIDQHRLSYETMYKYIKHISKEMLYKLCSYLRIVTTKINQDVILPEIILFILLKLEMYEESSVCVTYCNKETIDLNIIIMLELINKRIKDKRQEFRDKAIRLSLWLLQYQLITINHLPLYLQDLFDIWSKNLVSV